MTDLDPEILREFLAESGELLDALETDLVELEHAPRDPDLLNKIFRALHTIKGSASFLALAELVSIAHAAETTLNAARAGDAAIDREAMDLLLRAVDVLKRQFDQVRAREPIEAPDPGLVRALSEIGAGRPPRPAPPRDTMATRPEDPEPDQPEARAHAASPDDAPGATTRPLELSPSKADLFEFLRDDLEQSLGSIRTIVGRLGTSADRARDCEQLAEAADGLRRTVEYFELDTMTRLARAIEAGAGALTGLDGGALESLCARLLAALTLMDRQTAELHDSRVLEWPIDTLIERIETLIERRTLPDGADASPEDDPWRVLALDGVVPEGTHAPGPSPGNGPAPSETPRASRQKARERTIRVELGRLESLMNLVGELVLQKNRIVGLSRRFTADRGRHIVDREFREQIAAASSDLDRITAELQKAVMRTRMQPLDRIFGRYPRLIRDLAAKTGKRIELEIVGGETEVDKSVLDELGDPLIHLMRNSADHGIEPPDERAAAGKPARGTITLRARSEGGHVRVCVIDDGRGLDPAKIGATAVARGLISESELATLADREIRRFIFEPGFSTTDDVSDLSGRGVGMDVVRSSVQKINGTVDVESTPGEGTRFTITIPLTIAIMPAMLARIGREIYAVPLESVVEILKPDERSISTIGAHPVIRVRGRVLPVIDGYRAFEVPEEHRASTPFMIVLGQNDKRVGLMVSDLIGQQEVVIKPLDGVAQRGPISGATVREDGGVSLIVDVPALMRRSEGRSETRSLASAA